MAPDDTPNGPNGQTTGTAAPSTDPTAAPSTDPTAGQDPLKLAAETKLALDLMNGNTFEAKQLIQNMGVNPNALNSLGTTALGDVNENANAASGVNLSVLNAPTVAAPATDTTPATYKTADGGVTTDPDLAAPEEHHSHGGRDADAILPPDPAALGAAALDVAAITAMEMGDLGLAVSLQQKAEDLTERDNNDQQNNDDGTEGGPSLIQQEADTGIVVDGTISDTGINPDSYIDDAQFQYGTDADNISTDAFAPTPNYFADEDFGNTGVDGFNSGADPFAGTPNYFSNTATLGPDPFLNDPLAPSASGFSLDPSLTATPGTTSLAGLGPLNMDSITLDTGATALSANSLTGGTSLTGAGAFSLAPLSLDTTLAATTPATPVDPTTTVAATTPATTTPADPTTTVAATTPAAPATVALDTLAAGPDPFAAAPTLGASASLNTGTPSSSFLGTSLSAYSPAVASASPVATTFGDLSALSFTPANPSVYGTSFFDPVSVASTIAPPANDVSSKAPAIVAAAPRAQTSMSLS